MNIFNRLRALVSRKQKPSITMGICVFRIEQPIPIKDRLQKGKAWYGYWDQEEKVWNWGLQNSPYPDDTHYFPVSTDLLPVRCFCPLEVDK
jgi:hypothetical protein